MKNIINLVNMQFRSLNSVKKSLIIVVLLSVGMGIMNPMFIAFSGAMILLSMCYNPAFYEDKSKVAYLVHSLPIKPKEYVMAKFVFSGLITLLGIVFTVIECVIFDFLNIINFEDEISIKFVLLSILAIGIFMMTILVPASMILGFEKGRYILVFLMVGPMCFSTSLVGLLPNLNFNIGGTASIIIAVLAVMTLIVTSYFITSNLYAKKEVV